MSDTSDAPLQFQLRKLGHVVLNVTDLERSVRFYTEVLGLRSATATRSMVPGGMVFMRCNADHHGVALVGGAQRERSEQPQSLRLRGGDARRGVPRAGVAARARRADRVRRASAGRLPDRGRVPDPDGNNLEIYWGIDQVGTNGYVRPASEWRQARTLEDADRNLPPGQRLPLYSA